MGESVNTNVVEKKEVAPVEQKLLTLGFVPYGTGEHTPFNQIYPKARSVTPAMIQQGLVDVLVIWGGADISPTIYNEKPDGAHSTAQLTMRDQIEVDVCKAAIGKGIPIIGVCRGAQLVCALAGGKLYQHVTGHHGDHHISTDMGETYVTSSIHHQMMDVRGLQQGADYRLIAWSELPIAKEVKGAVEPEIVYFPKIKALAVQGHPEFMHPDCAFVQYVNSLVMQYLVKDGA